MKKVISHITIDGVPLCESESHTTGLINKLHITCGHLSLASAERTKKQIQKHRHSVKVVRGHCGSGEQA
tara:strand:- start:372 stop:578 length:207 start_codon:yes stop_codon:yes gene_type:complete